MCFARLVIIHHTTQIIFVWPGSLPLMPSDYENLIIALIKAIIVKDQIRHTVKAGKKPFPLKDPGI